ncbi:MAG: neutral/alkaline non-lysosomal ceramidase N-terminal domain-containing protein [Chloroflexi bacterium]|nr:neutral/alkaline non-lysosomal ceramidase N-terminal domain-containing protein [Chloroflexota bacterium]
MNTFYCGAGRADITLPPGTPMGGFANRLSACQGALDPLSARALLLADAHSAILIVTLDALAINAERAARLYEAAAASAAHALAGAPSLPGLTPAAVRVACSHTHSGADLSGMFGEAALIEAYFERVVAAVRKAAQHAAAVLAPAMVAVGERRFPIGRNRRMRPGHARVTDLERTQGSEIDHTLTVLQFTHAQTAAPLATLFHTACHPVCLGPENTLASGDFAGIAAQMIEACSGQPALFLNGACGNVTPLIGRGSTYEATRALAQSLADAVLDVDLRELVDAGLSVAPATLARLPLSCRFTTLAEINAAAAQLLEQDTGFNGWAGAVAAWRLRLHELLASGRLPSTVSVPLSLTRIGGLSHVFIGAEVFNEYQLWQPAGVRLVSYTDGEGCYIPTAAALAGGGYEVTTSPVYYGLPCAPGPEAEPTLLDAIRLCALSR